MGEFILGFGIFGIILSLIIFIVYLWSIFWAYKDAERRGKPGWLVALVVAFLAWPVGLLLWILVRPNDRQYYQQH
ncbi:hypothetical protein [Pontibacter actiniarum]|uniref:Cardiolipin synthase N-terminal domain-containing protein n=1 Tax=Pontibacter actiniarum TaxID=323450 RepID=A0A1X9YNI8_9BACT|nr:hypothetical protein [Pontibacter actiniarum]ARS34391.1 hypothetical protein CA264_02450 [Pontibacter actiniarum]